MKSKMTFLLLILLSVGFFTIGCTGLTKTSEAKKESPIQTVSSKTVTKSELPSKDVTDVSDNKTTDELHVLNIGFPSSGGSWPGGALGVANVNGILEEYLNPLGYTIKLQGFTGAAPAIHEALVACDLDFAYYAGMAGILAKSSGIDTKLLAIQSYNSNWELFASNASGITDIKDLKGSKISYTRGTATHEYLIKVLQEAGLTEADVKLVNMTIPEGIAAMITGAVDASVISLGQESNEEVSKAGVVIHSEREAGSENYNSPAILTGRTKFLEENKEVTIALLKALLKAKDIIIEDPDTYYKLYAKQSGYTIEYVSSAIAVKDIASTLPFSLDNTYLNKLTTMKEFLLDHELIANDYEFTDWVDASYLESAQQAYDNEK